MEFSSVIYLAGKLSGFIGFAFLSLLIFSGDTARFFDRFFGMDKIIKFQRKFSIITMVFVVLHPIFFILSTGFVLSFIIPDFSVIPFALGIVSLYLFLIIMFASKIYKRISYKIWQYIHILTYVLFFFALYHAINWGTDSGNFFIRILYGVLLTGIIIGIFYRTNYKIKQKHLEKFYVDGVKNETHDTFTLILKSKSKLKFKPGQFCFLRLNKERLYARHPFTISSSPNDDFLSFTIKQTGRFTKALGELVKGEEVIIDGPFGNFLIRDDKRDLVFIAGGVGITPFMSMIKDKLQNDNKDQKVTLLCGSRNKEDIILKKYFDGIKESWFKKVYILSNYGSSGDLDGYENGYINEEIVKKYVKDINSSIFYICGPEGMKESVVNALKELGVGKRNIIIEDFFW
ncbi:hypothetical protein CO058_03075 [candidate division WWE3 bacterium CG_4_9_14_0_2_um_filter_35_11]|uniref:FAD-binding FR-type domain-containing protein n=1 Tax=candidate division WWE3 bacterium CG_4_9_14_0_2_um_filter_35_11 TaxID=1975077 RepID=A0A2M8EL90_UNCKA|nr:MAG: hypothetical protein COV25_01500 [candidate division WWE3 bacterium CG10_big_fil_rev_8_21_14_0_10_35_32]PJC23512.1 MAG: hypothetical protein CO058_03075 [candidate division WWE3 bacterium CG_4_9_14_0_2_um_filter_35_11]